MSPAEIKFTDECAQRAMEAMIRVQGNQTFNGPRIERTTTSAFKFSQAMLAERRKFHQEVG